MNTQLPHSSIRCMQITGDAVGGIRLHVHTIIDELLNAGIAVSYVCSEHADTRGVEEIKRFQRNGLPVFRCAIQKRPSVSDLLNVFRILKFSRKNKINLIHGHGAKGGLYARLVGFLAGAKVIYTPHGGVVHAAFGPITTRVYALVERLLYPLTHQYVFESEYTRDAFLQLIGRSHIQKAIVNYNGVHPAPVAPTFHEQGLNCPANLLVVGMLRHEKGQEVMLRAAHVLKNRGLPFVLHFCGEGAVRMYLEQLCVELGLQQHVVFHGDVPDVKPFFAQASLVVIPSHFESFGYVALEAAQSGRAVVASRVGGLREVVVDGVSGLLFSAGDHLDLADKVQRFIQHPDQARRMAQAAFQRCHDIFLVQHMLANLMSVYKEGG